MINFLVIGAQKSGTTSLHEYLKAHPKIIMPKAKELDFFSSDKNYKKGIEFYHSFFAKNHEQDFLRGEASPQYMYKEGIAERIYKYNPKMKLIMCIRNPLDRAISHFNMNRRKKIEKRGIEQAFNEELAVIESQEYDPEFSYFRLGEYGRILQDYVKFFPKEQIHILTSDSLRFERKKQLNLALDFLEQEFLIPEDVINKEFHKSGKEIIPHLRQIINKASKISPNINNFLIKVFGRENISFIIHKIFTEYNVRKDKKRTLYKFDKKLIDKLYKHFCADMEKFCSISNTDINSENFLRNENWDSLY